MRRLLLVLIPLLAVAVYLGGPALLTRAGAYLIDEDPPAPADAIVVLAGSLPDRVLEAVTLYQDGFAPRVILSRGRENAAYAKLDAMGVKLPRVSDLNRAVAEQLKVPPTVITEVGGGMDGGSTLQEAQDVLRYVREQGYKKILLVTSKAHTRRAALIYRTLAAGGVEVIVRPSRYDRFQAQGWWRDRTDIRRVLIEYQKLLVFLLLDRWRIQPVAASPPATVAALG